MVGLDRQKVGCSPTAKQAAPGASPRSRRLGPRTGEPPRATVPAGCRSSPNGKAVVPLLKTKGFACHVDEAVFGTGREGYAHLLSLVGSREAWQQVEVAREKAFVEDAQGFVVAELVGGYEQRAFAHQGKDIDTAERTREQRMKRAKLEGRSHMDAGLIAEPGIDNRFFCARCHALGKKGATPLEGFARVRVEPDVLAVLQSFFFDHLDERYFADESFIVRRIR